MGGRNPMLLWFTSVEPILTQQERDRILHRWRHHRERMVDESTRFWMKVDGTVYGRKRTGRRRPQPTGRRPVGYVSAAHLEKYKRWRLGAGVDHAGGVTHD